LSVDETVALRAAFWDRHDSSLLDITDTWRQSLAKPEGVALELEALAAQALTKQAPAWVALSHLAMGAPS
jgi:hypothetical protein